MGVVCIDEHTYCKKQKSAVNKSGLSQRPTLIILMQVNTALLHFQEKARKGK
jgi:hypothetical protein